MIDNLQQIKSLLSFDSNDDFYHLQILKRKKEHPELGSNSVLIKTYYIRSLEYLDQKYPEIITLCNYHNARACINLNKRSFERIAFHTLRKVTDIILNKDFKSVRKAYESCCGSFSSESNKKWILDFDTKDESIIDPLIELLNDVRPIGPKYIAKLNTKNGYHIITSPFDIHEFNTLFDNWAMIPKLDVQKDNPTILYIPTEPLEHITTLLTSLTDDQRMDLFYKFCRSCGSTDKWCMCARDE